MEKVSGKSYQEFLLEQILEPLGLIHSGFEADPAGSEAAQGYGSFIVSDPRRSCLLPSSKGKLIDRCLVQTLTLS